MVLVGVALVFMAAALPDALAATYGSSSKYKLVGFTDDSKYVYFERHDSDMEDWSIWLRVIDAKTMKPVKAVRIEHDCGGDTCVSKKQGKRFRAKLYAKYGKPNSKPQKGRNIEEASWTIRDSSIETKTLLLGRLPDLMDGGDLKARFDLSVEVKVKAKVASVGKKKLWAHAVEDEFNGNNYEWADLYVQQLDLAPDGTSLALVFARKPFVVRLTPPGLESPAKSPVKKRKKAKTSSPS